MRRTLIAAMLGSLLAASTSAQPVPQVRLVYMVPADGIDRGLDTVRIPDAREEFQHWLSGKVPRRLRVDDAITFVRSSHPQAEMAGTFAAQAMTWIVNDLAKAGMWTPNGPPIGVYWDGAGAACGSGGETGGWHLGIVFLSTCRADTDYPQAYSLTMLHELIHGMGGVVSPTAKDRHVTDDPRDLMWPGIPPADAALDSDRLDYVGHGDPARFDLLTSPYFEPIAWCQSPDPFVALGRGTCCNGGWMPPGMSCPRTATVAPPVTITPPIAATPAPSPSTCSTTDPFVSLGGGTCCKGGWLPPGMACASSPIVAPAPAPQPAPPTSCPTVKPGANWTCVKGGWLPPGYPGSL